MKKNAFTLLIIVLILCGFGVSGAVSASVVVDRVVAVVNGEIITMSDLQRELARTRGAQDEKLALEELINRKLQMSAAKQAGMDVTEQELSDAMADIMRRNSMDQRRFETALAKEGLTIDQYRQELKEQMTLSRLFNKYVRNGLAVEEHEIRDYYDHNRASFALPEEIRVRQILIRVPPAASSAQRASLESSARRAADRARNGEDLSVLAREYSDGGDDDLGFMQRAHLLPELAEAAAKLSPGGIAGPVRTSLGFHVIRLEEVRTRLKTLDQVRDEISNLLFNQKLENTYRSWLQTLRNDSHIENRL